MVQVLFTSGSVLALVLVSALLLTLKYPRLQIWPPPAPRTWQSYLFWPSFRGLNVLCFATAISDWSASYVGLPFTVRVAALAVLAGSVSLFVYSFRVLGRDNSYGAQEGLVARGIYRWSRNPQNAMLMLVYGSLAIAADSGPTYLLCAAMMTGYALMVLAEEPWLRKVYGANYDSYCRSVPRFFHWRRAALTICARLQRLTRTALSLALSAILADYEALLALAARI